VWSLFAKGFRPDNPDFVLDHSSCLLCVSFHPLQPSLVAAGSFSGEVVVWDLSSSSSSDSFTAPAVSPIAEHVHKEPVVGVSWVRDPTGEGFLLSSAGADGKVLFWTMQNRLAHPVLGFTLSKGKTSRK
jgi:WD40 repeat protein